MIATYSRICLLLPALASLLLCSLIPSPAQAEYLITVKDRTIETPCYWIEKSRLHLCEGGEPLALSMVSSITEGSFTELEKELKKDTLRRFWIQVSWLLDREADLAEADRSSLDKMAQFDELKAREGGKGDILDLEKKAATEIRHLAGQVAYIRRQWSVLRTPVRSLVRLSEIKSLQMISWGQSLKEGEMYLRNSDPAYREYSLEHKRQADEFRESSTRFLMKVVTY